MKNTVALNPTKGSAGDDDELDKVMEIVILRETPTITILHIAGVTIAQVKKLNYVHTPCGVKSLTLSNEFMRCIV